MATHQNKNQNDVDRASDERADERAAPIFMPGQGVSNSAMAARAAQVRASRAGTLLQQPVTHKPEGLKVASLQRRHAGGVEKNPRSFVVGDTLELQVEMLQARLGKMEDAVTELESGGRLSIYNAGHLGGDTFFYNARVERPGNGLVTAKISSDDFDSLAVSFAVRTEPGVGQGAKEKVKAKESNAGARVPAERRSGDPLEVPSKEDLRVDASDEELRESINGGKMLGPCEEGKGRCFLSQGERNFVAQLLQMRIQGAAGHFQDALSEARVMEALTTADAGLLGLAVDVFYVLGRAGAPALAHALTTTTKAVFRPATLERIGNVFVGTEATHEAVTTRVYSEGMQKGLDSILRVGNRQARGAMKAAVASLGNEQRMRKKFFGHIKTSINSQVPEIWSAAATGMDDAELIVFAAWWDGANQTFEKYEAAISELLAAHKAVENLGTRGRHVRNVVGPHGQKRLAHCSFGYDNLRMLRDYSAEQRGTSSEQTFPVFDGWVDDRLVGAAEDRQVELAGKERRRVNPALGAMGQATGVKDIRWDAPWFFADRKLAKEHPEIQEWIEESTPQFKQEFYYPDGAGAKR